MRFASRLDEPDPRGDGHVVHTALLVADENPKLATENRGRHEDAIELSRHGGRRGVSHQPVGVLAAQWGVVLRREVAREDLDNFADQQVGV